MVTSADQSEAVVAMAGDGMERGQLVVVGVNISRSDQGSDMRTACQKAVTREIFSRRTTDDWCHTLILNLPTQSILCMVKLLISKILLSHPSDFFESKGTVPMYLDTYPMPTN